MCLQQTHHSDCHVECVRVCVCVRWREKGGVARSTRLCADSGNKVETAAAAAWQWRRKEWSNAKKIPPERAQKETDREGGKRGEAMLIRSHVRH